MFRGLGEKELENESNALLLRMLLNPGTQHYELQDRTDTTTIYEVHIIHIKNL